MQKLFWHIERGFGDTVELGKRHVRVVSGYCFHITEAISSLSILIDDTESIVDWIHETRDDVFHAHMGIDDSGYSRLSGFWGTVELGPWLIGKAVAVKLRVILENGQLHDLDIGKTQFVGLNSPEHDDKPAFLDNIAQKVDVAICMAAYKPDIDAFRRQVKSIMDQSHANWVCIINDDASPAEHYKQMVEICAEDKRFYLFQNRENTGFYRNFEQCLKRVPDGIEYIALSDQDDRWDKDKLELLRASIGDSALVYSDMRIVDEKGEVISDSYWQGRKNNYKDLDVLLIANTVTGAASMFKRSLLSKILPFPDRIGDLFHDHWIACVALLSGGLSYINKPLYDYIQYDRNVIGHCDFGHRSLVKKFASIFKWIGIVGRAIGKRFTGASASGKFKKDLLMLRDRLLAIYNYEYRRIQLTSMLLQRRCMPTARQHVKALKLFDGRPMSAMRLLMTHFSIWGRRHTTNDAEIRLLVSCIMYYVNKFVMRVLRAPLQRRVLARKQMNAQNNIKRVQFLENKIAPLTLNITREEPERVNIIVPEVRFDALFGGYIGKFNLAKRLYEVGCRVRMIIVDKCDYDPDRWRVEIQQLAGLQGLFAQVEFVYCHDRSVPINVNRRDIMVATTWWTAYIAYRAVSEMETTRFLYLIQEFEPFTFPMGSYYALAEQSYALPHNALFSTKLLDEYFQQNQYGVYSPNGRASKMRSLYFNNAILTFSVDQEKISNRDIQRLIFYARSDDHAARNMFEIGLLALKQCIEEGVFNNNQWEFWAMGTAYGDMPIAEGHHIKMIGKLALDTYQSLLPSFDLGLSLMYTPHPSLVPIEMAAAGLVVVSSECLNKNEASLQQISNNILAGQPTVVGIKEAIKRAVARVPDYEYRVASSVVDWPTDWNETFSDDLLGELLGWYKTSKTQT